jgi:hypothetical protein
MTDMAAGESECLQKLLAEVDRSHAVVKAEFEKMEDNVRALLEEMARMPQTVKGDKDTTRTSEGMGAE